MRVVLQRVSSARVRIEGAVVGEIANGWLALLGVGHDDGESGSVWLAEKIVNLRAFEDEAGKMNLSLLDVNGSILVVSNFTLHADCQKGRRPSFIDAAPPAKAELLYLRFLDELKKQGVPVQSGRFGADMHVELTNDGPVTFVIDSPK